MKELILEDLTDKGFYVISDTHFYHGNIIKYCNRPFVDTHGNPDVETMNMVLFDNWNRTVGKTDKIFHLGDFTMGFQKKQVSKILDENLNGDKKYLVGNHDFPKMIPGKMIKDKVHYVMYKGLKIAMSHYPHKGENAINWDADILLFGHIHNNSNFEDHNTYNCCVEQNDYKPIHIDDVIKKLIKRNEK